MPNEWRRLWRAHAGGARGVGFGRLRAPLILLVRELAIARTSAVFIAIERVHAAMFDQETGLRGFLLTHDAHFMESYRRGVAIIVIETDLAMHQLAKANELIEPMLQMRLSAQLWTSEWASVAVTMPVAPVWCHNRNDPYCASLRPRVSEEARSPCYG